jgi:tetratricopeptide (TPR) repeat protein
MSDLSVKVEPSLESLVGQVADDFLRRQREGEQPDVEEYVARYPQAAELLRTVLVSLRLLDFSQPGRGAPPTEGAPPVAAEEVAGTLGDFRILREVGRGGMGVVYEAVQISLGRTVALKVLPFAAALDARQLQRFKNEAQAAACLHHTNIVPVFAVGCERGVHFYAMQLIDGQTLAAVIADLRQREDAGQPQVDPQRTAAYNPGRPAAAGASKTDTPLAQALSTERPTRSPAFVRSVARLGMQAAEALEHAHQVGVVHRDVKPGNLMVDVRGNLWVADFGLAHIKSDTPLTMTGDLVGTLRYMSPEQALAQRVVVDHRTDVYSLGATLYELLTLRPAFDGGDRQELLRQIAFDEPQALRRINKAVPSELETVVLKAMAKNPAERYDTAQELADDLGRFLRDEAIRARRPTLLQRARRWARRHKPVVASLASVAALLVVAVVAGALLYAARASRLAHERVLTNDEINVALREALKFEAQAAGRRDPLAWARAREMARQAETLAQSNLADPALVAQVHQLRGRLDEEEKDRWMLARVEEAILASANAKGNIFDTRQAADKYAAAFREYGIDAEVLAPEEVARRIQERAIQTQLVAAIDTWATFTDNDPNQKRLWAIARLADQDRWRNQIRDAIARGDLPVLKKLSTSAEVVSLPAPTLLLLAHSLARLGDRSAAAEVLRGVRQRHRDDFWINHNLGIYLLEKQPTDPEGSVRFLTAAMVLRSQSPGAHYNLGNALRDKGQLDEAITEYREAISLNEDYASAHYNLGIVLHAKGKVDEAIACYQKTIALYPKVARAHYNLGNALKGKGQVDEAIACYQKAIAIDSKYADAHTNLGNALHDKGKVDEAIAFYHQAITLDPSHAHAHANLGLALHDKGQVDEAITCYRKAITLDSRHARAHNNLGNALQDKGKVDEAIACHRRAIALDPRNANAHNSLGNALQDKGKVEEAIACYRTAIALDPRHARAHYNLGKTLQDKGKADEAIACYKEAIRLNKDYPEAYCHLGGVLRDQGCFAESLRALKTGHELGSRNAKWRYPSAAWVRQAERLVELDARLPGVLSREAKPTDAAEQIALADLCARYKGLFAASARLYAGAFSVEPKLAEGVGTQHRYHAACAATLAGCGQGKDAGTHDDPERARLRRQALSWLRADLAAWRKHLEAGPAKGRSAVQRTMQHWLRDTDLAGVRDQEALAKLPEAERQDWQKLWADVKDLWSQSAGESPRSDK